MFFSTLMVVSHLAIKSFDLVMALTARRPGLSPPTCRPPSCTRWPSRAARSAWARLSATVMLATVAAIVVPYLYSEAEGQAIAMLSIAARRCQRGR